MLYTVSLKSAAHWHPSFPSNSRDENKKTWVSAIVGAGVGVCLLPTMILMKSKVARWDRKTACAYKVCGYYVQVAPSMSDFHESALVGVVV